jgi:hypothetical protein
VNGRARHHDTIGPESEAVMFRTVEGTYRNGNVQFHEIPDGVRDGTRVLVTFLALTPVDLAERGIDPAAAAELRARLATFADEWDNPEMDIYNDYDAAWAGLQAR